MPAQYTIDIKNKIVTTNFSGIIQAKDIRDLLTRLAKDSSFGPEFTELAVVDDECSLRLSFLDFQALQPLDPFSRRSKRAVVVGRSRTNYGLARMFQVARNESANVRVFEELKDASRWLSSREEQVS